MEDPAEDKDWEARFKLSELKAPSAWPLRLLDMIDIPIGPWFVDLPVAIAIGVLWYLRSREKTSSQFHVWGLMV